MEIKWGGGDCMQMMPSAQFREDVRTELFSGQAWVGMVRATDRPVCRWLSPNLVIPHQESVPGTEI